MVRTLLAERFKLARHTETKGALFVRADAGQGPKIKVNEMGCPPRVSENRGRAVFRNVPLTRLTTFLPVEMGSAVVDKTGLTGNYDLRLEFVSSRGPLNSNAL
jgi:uncharacterized protein (TIGR03435 family)